MNRLRHIAAVTTLVVLILSAFPATVHAEPRQEEPPAASGRAWLRWMPDFEWLIERVGRVFARIGGGFEPSGDMAPPEDDEDPDDGGDTPVPMP